MKSHLLLPAIALALGTIALTSRMTRSAMLESLAADFPFVMQRASQAAKAEVLRQNEAATATRPSTQDVRRT